jgi:hypothetical protein
MRDFNFLFVAIWFLVIAASFVCVIKYDGDRFLRIFGLGGIILGLIMFALSLAAP